MRNLEMFSKCSDVSFLLTSLRLAKKNTDDEMQQAILERLMQIGVLRLNVDDDPEHANLKQQVKDILGPKDYARLLPEEECSFRQPGFCLVSEY